MVPKIGRSLGEVPYLLQYEYSTSALPGRVSQRVGSRRYGK